MQQKLIKNLLGALLVITLAACSNSGGISSDNGQNGETK